MPRVRLFVSAGRHASPTRGTAWWSTMRLVGREALHRSAPHLTPRLRPHQAGPSARPERTFLLGPFPDTDALTESEVPSSRSPTAATERPRGKPPRGLSQAESRTEIRARPRHELMRALRYTPG
jgi:hypothetical protein